MDRVSLGSAFATAAEVLTIGLCLVLAIYFTAAETALTAMSDAKTRSLMEQGGVRRSLLRYWVDRTEAVLTTILVGKHAASTTLVLMIAFLAERAFDRAWFAVVAAFLTVAVLVVVEIVPRSVAKGHAPTIAPLLMPGVVILYFALWPLVFVLMRIGHLFTRMSGGAVTRTGPFVTEEDIVQMIRRGGAEGVLDKQEGRMLASIMELGDTLVKQVMVPRTRIVALPIDATEEQVIAAARSERHSRIPVYDDTLDNVRGFFHTKDLLDAIAGDKSFELREHLREIACVPELMRTSDLLKLFQKKRTHLAIVVDEYGGTSGLVALEDVLEEIVGPIEDEHDEDTAQSIKKLDDGRYVFDGTVDLFAAGDALHTQLPTDADYDTLGGFVTARLGRLPLVNDRVTFGGWTFVVKDADEKMVKRIEARPFMLVDQSAA